MKFREEAQIRPSLYALCFNKPGSYRVLPQQARLNLDVRLYGEFGDFRESPWGRQSGIKEGTRFVSTILSTTAPSKRP